MTRVIDEDDTPLEDESNVYDEYIAELDGEKEKEVDYDESEE